jgi:hypothetical protein
MPARRHIIYLLAAALATVAPACGGAGGDPAAGLAKSVDKARAAKTLTSLQTGLVTLNVVQAESAATGGSTDMVVALQSKDPTNRYTTAPPADTGTVQVVGGGGAPVMLVAISDPAANGQPAQYVAVWQGSGTTMYYAGTSPPAYTADPPQAAGWGSTIPQ